MDENPINQLKKEIILFENNAPAFTQRNAVKNNQIQIIGNPKALEYISYIELTLTRKHGQRFYCQLDFEDYNLIKHHIWSLDVHNYVISTELEKNGGKKLYLHRLILEKRGFDLNNKEIDHINGDRKDNRKSNLRICIKQKNTWNSTKRPNTTSKFKGVCFDSSRQKWKASLQCDGKIILNKRCNSEIEAALLYNDYAKKYFGEFAKLNIIK